MISSDQAQATIRLGFLEHLAAHPPRIMLVGIWPIAIAQSLFYTMLGRVTGGPGGGEFAFTGSVAMVLTLSTIGGLGYLPGEDKAAGTFHRLQQSDVSPATIFALRSLPWLGQAMIAVLLCLAVTGPLTGHAATSLALLPLLPLLLLMAASSAAAGLAVASTSLGRRAEVLANNGFQYLLIVAGGMVVPAGRAPVLDAIGSMLPLRHGVLAIRAYLDPGTAQGAGGWVAQAGLEAIVGIGWAAVAAGLYRWQGHRARVHATGDFV